MPESSKNVLDEDPFDIARRPIGIFDSGIGGLTVVREIIRRLPGESLVYFGDTARVPYGTKSDRTVREFAWEDSLFLLGHGVKVIVVACNTASAVVLKELQKYLKVPVIGVIEPGAQRAASVTRNRRIGIIGTQATIASGSYEAAVRNITPECEVLPAPCPLFVPLVEEGWIEGEVPRAVARRYLDPLIQWEMDTLILGCTHYPLLKPLISSVCGKSVTLVDSAAETARAVASQLEAEKLLNPGDSVRRSYFVSDFPRRFSDLAERFLGMPLEEVTVAEPWKSSRPLPAAEGG